MRPLSLKSRVTLLTMAIIATVIVVIAAVAYHELKESLERAHDPTLSAAIATIRSRMRALPPQPTQDDLEAIIRNAPSADAIELLVWYEGGGDVRIIHASEAQDARAWIAGLDPSSRPDPGKLRRLTLQYGNTPCRAAWLRQPLADGVLSMLAMTPVDYAHEEMEEFLRMLLILGAGMVLVAGVLTALSVPWALRPIRVTARRLRGVTHRNFGSERLKGVCAPAELSPFVDSVRAMLARVNEGVQSQKRFIAEASHELRTPLALAKSTIQAAQLKVRTIEEYRRTLDELLGDVDRLTRLAGQLLDMARLDETVPNVSEDVAVGPMLRALADRFEAEARASGGRIICDLPIAPLTVKGSPIELERLFANLIDNAVKHGPGGGTITLRAAAEATACLVTVHDQGGGIPADQLDRLFDRFYRADESHSRATGGSGLGLAIARPIARRHGGEIWITSSPADGTAVSVRLPLKNLA